MRILYLDLDTLRPDHLSCYGYHRLTSPNIDRIASDGVRFEQCYASDVPCCPSRTALMTGRFGIHTGLVGHGGSSGDIYPEGPTRGFRSRLGHESLPGFLRENGYHTATISPFPDRHGAYHFHAGFRETYDTGKAGMESAEDVTPVALDWLHRNAERDQWFLHLNYWDPHVPYRVPLSFGNPFADDPMPAWLTDDEIARQIQMIGFQRPHRKQLTYRRYAKGTYHPIARTELPPLPRNPNQIETPNDVRAIIDGYDSGVRYLDDHLGRIFGMLDQLGVLDETAIIMSADHGENLGELGIYGDHVTADNATCHVPMIVRWPGGQRGHVDSGLHYQLDLAPTLAALTEADPVERWDGHSFAAAITEGRPCGREALILSTGTGTCQRSVRFANWLYLRTYHDGYNDLPDELLFDIVTDPHEVTDLASERPDVCADGAARLADWHGHMMATMPNGYSEDPLATVIREGGPIRQPMSSYLEDLEATGRHTAAEELRRRHAAAIFRQGNAKHN